MKYLDFVGLDYYRRYVTIWNVHIHIHIFVYKTLTKRYEIPCVVFANKSRKLGWIWMKLGR